MENNLNTTEQNNARADGFVLDFLFFDGQLYCTLTPEKGYYPKDLQIAPKPCYIGKHIVYRITTDDGQKGILINVPNDPLSDF